MAYDAFIKIETPNVEGESTASKFEKQIEVYSFSWGANQPVTIGSGSSGAAGGKVSISDFNFMKKLESSSTKLFSACCTGNHFGKVTVTLRKAGGTANKQIVFNEYIMEEVYVSSYQLSGSSGGDDTPTESISMAFSKITFNYYPQKTDGGQGTVSPASWDLKTVEAT